MAFSFTRNAREEVARVKAEKGLEIVLVTVDELLKDKTNIVTPVIPPTLLDDEDDVMPLAKGRSGTELPSVEELIASNRGDLA